MPRVPTYTDDEGVQLNLPLAEGSGYRVNMDYSGAYQGNRQFSENLMGFSRLFNSIAIKQQALVNQTHVNNAVAAAQDQLNALRNQSLNVLGENVMAKPGTDGTPGTPDLYGRWQDGSSDIINKARSGLQNAAQRQQFDNSMNSLMPELNNQIGAHQMKQINFAQEQSRKAQMASTLSMANSSVNIGDNIGANIALNKLESQNAEAYAVQGIPLEQQKQLNADQEFKWYSDTIDQLTKDGKSYLIEDLLKQTGAEKRLNKDQYQALQKMNAAGMEDNEISNIVDQVIANHKKANGEIDLQGAMAELDAIALNHGRNKSDNASFDTFYQIAVMGESSGDHNSVNPDSGASGLINWMPNTWNKYTGGAPMTEENDAYYSHKYVRELYDKFGQEGALVAIYAGEANGQRWVDGEPDAIGDDGGHYSWDAIQYSNGHKYPSVRQYVETRMAKIREAEPTDAQVMDQSYRKKLDAKFNTKLGDYNRVRQQQNEELINAMLEFTRNNPNASLEDIRNEAEALAPNDLQRQEALTSAGYRDIGMDRSEDNYQEAQTYDQAYQYVIDHPEGATEGNLRMLFPGMKNQRYAQLVAASGRGSSGGSEGSYKWLNDDTRAFLEGSVQVVKGTGKNASDSPSGLIKSELIAYTNQKVAQWIQDHNGEPPSADVVKGFLAEGARKPTVKGMFWGTNETSFPASAVPIGAKITGVNTIEDSNGITETWDPNTRTWRAGD